MFFKYDKTKPEEISYKTLITGDMFRFNNVIYIKLDENKALNILTDEIIDYNMPDTVVELLDYEIIIYSAIYSAEE